MAATDPDELARLEEERRFLLRSLADLEREHAAGDLDDLDHQTLRDDYTARAAVVLRAIDEGRAKLAPKPTHRRRRRTLVLAGVTVLLAAGAGVAVAQSSGTRLAGEGLTGSTGRTTAQVLSEARARGQQAARERDPAGFIAAAQLYDEVLDGDPQDVEALAYRGWMLFQVVSLDADGTLLSDDQVKNLLASGEQSLDKAISLQPGYADARAFKGIYELRVDDDAAAAMEQFTAFLASDPAPIMRSLMADVITEAAQAAGVPAPDVTDPGVDLTPATTVAPG